MSNKTTTPPYVRYLSCRDKKSRLSVLEDMESSGQYLPLSLAEDLLLMELETDEKTAILRATSSDDSLAYEHFLTENLLGWDQNLATLALKIWESRTDHFLWFRLLQLLNTPMVPQRVRYTILDACASGGGRHLLHAAARMEGLPDMSAAFHGLLLHRCVQWNFEDQAVRELALDALEGLGTHLHPENKALSSAFAYLARFSPNDLKTLIPKPSIAEPWRDLARTVVSYEEHYSRQADKLKKLVQKPPKSRPLARLMQLWPPLWMRQKLEKDVVSQALSLVIQQAPPSSSPRPSLRHYVSQPWELFAGIPEDVLIDALAHISDKDVYVSALQLVYGFLETPASKDLKDQIGARLAEDSQNQIFDKLPRRLAAEIAQDKKRDLPAPLQSRYRQLQMDQDAVLRGAPHVPLTDFGASAASLHWPATEEERHNFKNFMKLAYRGRKGGEPTGDDFWALLCKTWSNPTTDLLEPLAKAARQVEGLFRICYIKTLGRFEGQDMAALKLLDFIRSKESDDIRTVITALDGIGTPRACQELVSALTRPNVPHALRLEICGVLQNHDLTGLQAELRSAINDLGESSEGNDGHWELKEAISQLLQPISTTFDPATDSGSSTITSDQQLDQVLASNIPHYRELSSEVKRALRTSQFFHVQVSGTHAPESIDLSPVIDMQYKALELLFRETFEEPCSRLIHTGILQRKLDVIGYARPVPRAMDEFENFLGSLPTIRDIPFFSKFKLRKMLRAICQFRPGRRFTLDGLKAFALFFLTFSRKSCRYGLQEVFPIGFRDDQQLFEFCKRLHVLQDFRNRAAHEGFHPDASNDIEGIWRTTAEIVQTAFKVKSFMDQQGSPPSRDLRLGRGPIIEKKVS